MFANSNQLAERVSLPVPRRGDALGTVGSEETTLVIHKAAYLVYLQTDHHRRVLLLTFTVPSGVPAEHGGFILWPSYSREPPRFRAWASC